jgi:hypothetical protein
MYTSPCFPAPLFYPGITASTATIPANYPASPANWSWEGRLPWNGSQLGGSPFLPSLSSFPFFLKSLKNLLQLGTAENRFIRGQIVVFPDFRAG